MLTAVNGYIDDNRVIVDENIADWQGRNVIVTILDSVSHHVANTIQSDASGRAAAMELAGLWKDHDNELSVEETVRNMRKGRRFDS